MIYYGQHYLFRVRQIQDLQLCGQEIHHPFGVDLSAHHSKWISSHGIHTLPFTFTKPKQRRLLPDSV